MGAIMNWRGLLAALSLIFVGAMAQAGQSVDCLQGDCFTYGWDIWTERPNWPPAHLQVQCKQENCLQNGWILRGQGVPLEITCKAGGCFQSGWYVFQGVSDRVAAEVNCLTAEGDDSAQPCLKNGWRATDWQGRSETLQCLGAGCEQDGWLSWTPGYPKVRTRCKEGGCFVSGWITNL